MAVRRRSRDASARLSAPPRAQNAPDKIASVATAAATEAQAFRKILSLILIDPAL